MSAKAIPLNSGIPGGALVAGLGIGGGSVTDASPILPGIFKAAVDAKRLTMIVEPAWEANTRKSIWDMMERAVKAGFYQNMPDDKIFYAP